MTAHEIQSVTIALLAIVSVTAFLLGVGLLMTRGVRCLGAFWTLLGGAMGYCVAVALIYR